MPRRLISLLVLLACQALYLPAHAIDENSPLLQPPVGSTLQLRHEITIPADDAGVKIQAGKVSTSSWHLDQYSTFCDFELKSRSAKPRTVPPQIFTITRVVRRYENVQRQAPVRVASLDKVAGLLAESDGGPPLENNMLVMYLHSDTDTDALRITCQHWMDAATGDAVSIADIRNALGELFILKLAP